VLGAYPYETSFFMLSKLLPCVYAILCLFIEPVLASIECIATTHVIIVALPHSSPCMCFLGCLFTRSALGLIGGVLRISYLQLHHIYPCCCVIFISLGIRLITHVHAVVCCEWKFAVIHFGTVRFIVFFGLE
jgi:hypothetical protein